MHLRRTKWLFAVVVFLSTLVLAFGVYNIFTAGETPEHVSYGFSNYSQAVFDGEEISFPRPNINKVYEYRNGKKYHIQTSSLEVKNQTIGVRGFNSPRMNEDVAFIGASHTFGAGVDTNDTFAQKFKFQTGLSTVNLGVPGAGFREFNLVHKHILSNRSVDKVVVLISKNTAISQKTIQNLDQKVEKMEENGSISRSKDEEFAERFSSIERDKIQKMKETGYSVPLRQMKERAENRDQEIIFINRDPEIQPGLGIPYGVNSQSEAMARTFGPESDYRIKSENSPLSFHYNEKGHELLTKVIIQEMEDHDLISRTKNS